MLRKFFTAKSPRRNFFSLTPEVHGDLKRALADGYPEMSASNRAEALARGLGFRTNSALVASLPGHPDVAPRPASFMEFAKAKGATGDGRPFGLATARHVFGRLGPEHPRWAAMAIEEWPWAIPHVCRSDLGMAHAVAPPGTVPPGASYAEAMAILADADQRSFRLEPHSGTNVPWHRRIWDESTGQSSLWGDPSGLAMRGVYAGMGHWLFDLGEYVGGHPWPS